MTSLPTAYTPLESLLLFQALRSEGVNGHAVFNRISEQLKSSPLVHSHPSFDSGRLSPDALRELYLWLLKEEVKSDLQRQFERQSPLPNGDVSPASRKRKAASPSLPTVHEASKHAHLIPQLVTRLYARYREHTVREIREHERQYEALSREIDEIEAGKWDERLQRQRTVSATQSPPPSSSSVKLQSAATHPTRSATVTPVSPQATADSTTQVTSKPYTQNKIDAVINHESEQENGVSTHRRNSSNTTLPSLQQMAPRSPQLGIPPKIPVPGQSPAFNHSPTNSLHSPFHANPVPPSMASPQVHTSLSRPSSSPRPYLPPPPGMKLPPASPVQHVGSPNLHGPPLGQQHYPPPQPSNTMPTAFSPTSDHPPVAYPPHQQPPSGYYQQPYLERRTSYPPPQQQIPPGFSNQASHLSNYHIPSFPLEPQEALQGRIGQPLMQQQPGPMLQQPPNHAQGPPSYPQYSATAPSTGPRPVRPPNTRLVTDIIAALATPPRRPVWKSERDLQPIKTGTPIPRPDVEPLSPVLKRSEPSARTTRATRNRGGTFSEQAEELEALPMPMRTRGRPKRDRSPHSIVSSTADESRMTRSQSVSTTAGALTASDDRPVSRGNVKIEPSTPAGIADETDTTHELMSGARVTRKRRGTLQSLPQPPSKRKRQQSVSATADAEFEDFGTPPPRPTTLLATRNFHKLSATVMNDINSHKHASYFVNPVRDKDAPGYSEIIKQPQHLKSIRTAVVQGTKAVNTATANMDSPSTAGAAEGAASVELERTEDIIPPKGIVNAAQLEKEVLRMFANAVMFNPGEDGMVRDTREMFEAVNAKIQEWRGADKDAGENEDEEGKAKRRKM